MPGDEDLSAMDDDLAGAEEEDPASEHFTTYVGAIAEIGRTTNPDETVVAAIPVFGDLVAHRSGFAYSLLPRAIRGDLYPLIRSHGDGRRRVAIYEISRFPHDPNSLFPVEFRYAIEFDTPVRDRRAMSIFHRANHEPLLASELQMIVRQIIEANRVATGIVGIRGRLMRASLRHTMPTEIAKDASAAASWMAQKVWKQQSGLASEGELTNE